MMKKKAVAVLILPLLVAASACAESWVQLETPVSRQIVQRGADDRAALAVSGTFGGDSSKIEVRAVALGDAGKTSSWTVLEMDEGRFSGTVDLPAGWYRLELRVLNGMQVGASVVVDKVGVGDLFITAGQSNSASFGQGTPAAQSDRVSYFNLASGAWTHAQDPAPNPSKNPGSKGSPWPKLGDLLAAEHAIPIGFLCVGDGSSSVASWLPDSNDNYPNLKRAVQTMGTNGFKAVLWHQGESDSGNRRGVSTTKAAYEARLNGVIAASRKDAGWEFPWGIALVSHTPQINTNPAIRDAQLQAIAADETVFQGADTDTLIGLPYRGGVHFRAEGLNAHAQLWLEAINNYFYPVMPASPRKKRQVDQRSEPRSLKKKVVDKFAFTEFKPSREFVYKSIDGVDLKLYVFDPEGHRLTDESPVIVLFFGGGWSGGQPARLSGQCDFFAKQGIVAITADYRVKGRNKTTPVECVKDGKSAIRWVRAHAAELGIDPNKVIGGGASAGGHVAAATGTAVPFNEETDDLKVSARPNALVLFNPVFDNGPGGYGHDRVSEYWKQISPMHNINAETPPTIVFFGDNDKHVPVATAQAYKKRMEAQGQRCDLFIYESQGHGFFNYRAGGDPVKNQYFSETLEEAATFLQSLGYINDVGK